MPERAEKPAFAVHREIAGGPHRRQAHIAGEHGVLCRHVTQNLRDLLWVDELLARHTDRLFVETLAHLLIVLDGLIEAPAILLLLQQREQGIKRNTHIANKTQMDRCATAELLRPNIDLGDASGSLRIKLTIREI